MIRVHDALILAGTKLRTRKVRTIITAATASLLFGLLVAAVVVIAGVIHSGNSFMKSGLSERYIASYAEYGDIYEDTASLRTRATQLYNERIVAQKAAAKQLGIEYDQSSEPKPTAADGGVEYLVNDTPSTKLALQEYYKAQKTKAQKASDFAQGYHPKAVYDARQNLSLGGVFSEMKDGAENLEKTANGSGDASYGMSDAEVAKGWSYLDSSLADAFLLEKRYLDKQVNKTDIPVIAPYTKVQEALKLPKLPNDATSQQKLDRLQYVRTHAASATFTICYRNQESLRQLSEVYRVQKEVDTNKGNKEYKKPSLVYGAPDASACEAPVIVSDTRTASEKTLTEKHNQFKEMFGESVRPQQQKITFRVVGISPSINYGSFSGIDMLVSTVLGSTLWGSWVVPQGMYDQMPNAGQYDAFYPTNNYETAEHFGGIGQLIEFNSASDLKRFYDEKSCVDMSCSNASAVSYFGSNSVVIDDMKKSVTTTLVWSVAVIGGIAAIITMGIIGRVLADSRRETAVFRAIGATRNDIRIIYTIYTLWYGLIIAGCAMIIGFAIAIWVDARWSNDATAQAQLTFLQASPDQKFYLIGMWPEALLGIASVVVVACLVSMLLPLSRNLARNPIKDMRDE